MNDATSTPEGRKLTEHQRDVLDALKRHGHYEPGGGWAWGNHSSTVRTLDRLIKRGLVTAKTLPVGLDHVIVYRPVESEV